MAKSKIIKDLVTEKITLTEALDRLLIIAMELEDESLLKWVRQEKSGYETDEGPEYRKVGLEPIGTFQVVSSYNIITYKNKPLPTMGVSQDLKEAMDNYFVKDGVATIFDTIQSIEGGKTAGISVPPELFYMFQKNTNMTVTNASWTLNKTCLVRIINTIKTRTLEILTMLEKNFGCLDDLDIDARDYDIAEMQKLKEELFNIIDGKPSGTTYIISNSKIKGSTIGEENEIKKENHLEVNTTVSPQEKKKKSFWARIWRWIKKLFGGNSNG